MFSRIQCSVLVFAALMCAYASDVRAQRLPLSTIPENYSLSFSPDLSAERFDGRARIRVRVLAVTSRFVLHAAGLTIHDAAVIGGGVRQPARVSIDMPSETATLTIDIPLAPATAELELRFSGVLSRDLRGFYISEANGRKYAVTQLEATDARRMFPSFDEPSFKASFDISAVISEKDTAISNGPVIAVEPGPDPGKKTVRFGTTAPMSTYLVALAIGDFVCEQGGEGEVALRVCATPDKHRLTRFAVDATDFILDYFNRYFAIDYPFKKLDLVAIPDFAAGAMENTGAVFFRESLLLVAEDASLSARKRAALVIAHELAHQWFGNLVTMAWWDDLWLNEGFATWMETKAIAAWRPEWHVELDALQSVQQAMAVDVMTSTRPVRMSAEKPADIEALFDPIAYEKGAAILAMVESFTGNEAFRGGINAYLSEFQYDNATAEDFWSIVTRATGKPVDRIMESFVTRAGVPLVSIDVGCHRDLTTVTVTQEQFRPTTATTPKADGVWAIPLCLKAPGSSAEPQCELLDRPRTSMTVGRCASPILANPEASGYFRTRYSANALERLTDPGVRLTPAERLQVIADEWALLRAGHGGVGRFLALVDSMADDVTTPAVLSAIGARLGFVHEYLVSDGDRPALEAWVRSRFSAALAEARRSVASSDMDHRRVAALLGIVGAVGRDRTVLADARQKVTRQLANGRDSELAPDTLDALVALAALVGDPALYEQYRSAAENAQTPEQRYRFLYALPAFRDPALIRRTIGYAFSSAIRAQDRALFLGRVLSNPAARDVAWDVIQRRWDELQSGVGAFGGTSRVIEALGSFCSTRRAEEIRDFFKDHQVPGAGRTLAQTIEDIERCASLAQSQRPMLTTALHDATPVRQ